MKVLFLGLGGVGQRHLRNFHELTHGKHQYLTVSNRISKYEISNALELNESVDIFKKYSIKVFPNIDQALLLKPKLSIISTPSSLHFEQTKLALKNGSNVYLEKPATLTKKECQELALISKKKNLKISVSFQLRFMPWLKKVKEILNSNKYGRPLFVSALVSEYMPDWHKYEDYKNSYASRKELGGGVVFTQIHELDYLIYLFGTLKFHSAIGGKFSDLNINVEDTAFSLLYTEYMGKIIPIKLSQDYLGQPKSRELIIQFASVRLICDFVKGNLRIESSDKVLEFEEYKSFERNDAFKAQLKKFIDLMDCKTNDNAPVSLSEALLGIEIAEKIKKDILLSLVDT